MRGDKVGAEGLAQLREDPRATRLPKMPKGSSRACSKAGRPEWCGRPGTWSVDDQTYCTLHAALAVRRPAASADRSGPR